MRGTATCSNFHSQSEAESVQQNAGVFILHSIPHLLLQSKCSWEPEVLGPAVSLVRTANSLGLSLLIC